MSKSSDKFVIFTQILTPTMKKLLILCLLLGGVACGTSREVKVLLNWAEAEMEYQPDSVMRCLAALDRSLLRTPSAEARHALLYSQALDKCYVDLTSDTLICRAVDYYERRGSDHEQALAGYYHGVVHMNAGELDEAVEAFARARLAVEKCDDDFLKSLISSCFGNLYYGQGDFENSLKQHREAYRLFTQLEQPYNRLIMLESIGTALWELHKDQAAIDTLEMAEELARELEERYPKKRLDIFLKLGIAKSDWQMGTDQAFFARAKEGLYTYCARYNEGKIPFEFYPFLGQIHLYDNELDSARYYLKAYLFDFENSPNRDIGYFQHLAEVERQEGNLELALDLERTYSHLLDSIHQVRQDVLVANLEQQHLFRMARESEELLLAKHRYMGISYLLVATLIVLALVNALIRLRRVARERREKMELYQGYVNESEHHYDELMSKYVDLQRDLDLKDENMQRLYAMLGNRIESIRYVVELAHLHSSNPDLFYKRFRERVKLSADKSRDFARDVIEMADITSGGSIGHLREEYPTLTLNELCYCSLLTLGFSKESIRILYNHTNPNSIYNIHNSIRTKFGLVKSGPLTLEAFLKEKQAPFLEKRS